MQTSVNLQDFIISPIVLLFIVMFGILGMTIYFLKHTKEKEQEKPKQPIQIKEIPVNNKKAIIQKYIKKLNELEEKVDKEKIEIRQAYQTLSNIIRYFVYEVTNVKVQNYTLEEIENAKMPSLYELVEEYYKPEFAKQSLGDIKNSINKTRKVIEKWN